MVRLERIRRQHVIGMKQVEHEGNLHLVENKSHRYPTFKVLTSCNVFVHEIFREKRYCVIMPHNFKEVSYLNLEDMWYTLDVIGKPSSDITITLITESFEEYVDDRTIFSLFKTLRNKRELPTRMVESLLAYSRISGACKFAYFAEQVFWMLIPKLHMHCSYKYVNILRDFLTVVCEKLSVKRTFMLRSFPVQLLTDMLRFVNITRYNIWEIRPNARVRDVVICPVLYTLMSGFTSSFEVFIQYGFEREEIHCDSRNRFYSTKCPIFTPEVLPEFRVYNSGVRRKYLILETFYLLRRYCEPIAARIVITDWRRQAYLLFRSIPDPYVTLDELRSLELEGNFLNNYKKYFEEIFATQYEPRYLKHLCRCTIRRSLRGNFQLPNGLYELGLPYRLILYLLLVEEW